MKLLLTSAGFTNKSIVSALTTLVGRPFNSLSLAFIPTAANVEEGSKDWLIDDLVNCKKLGFASVDIVDISALPPAVMLSRLEKSDIIFVGGGNSFHLMSWVIKSGLGESLPEMLKTKIYVGLSAGSCITAKWWSNKWENELYGERSESIERFNCLGLVDFLVFPHLGQEMFPKVNLQTLEVIAKAEGKPVYVLDDNSAVTVNREDISVVSEGLWQKFN